MNESMTNGKLKETFAISLLYHHSKRCGLKSDCQYGESCNNMKGSINHKDTCDLSDCLICQRMDKLIMIDGLLTNHMNSQDFRLPTMNDFMTVLSEFRHVKSNRYIQSKSLYEEEKSNEISGQDEINSLDDDGDLPIIFPSRPSFSEEKSQEDSQQAKRRGPYKCGYCGKTKTPGVHSCKNLKVIEKNIGNDNYVVKKAKTDNLTILSPDTKPTDSEDAESEDKLYSLSVKKHLDYSCSDNDEIDGDSQQSVISDSLINHK